MVFIWKKKVMHTYRMAWGWVNHGVIYIFEWTIPLIIHNNEKNQTIYSSSDVQQKIVELHKLESGYKKRAKALKILISTKSAWKRTCLHCLKARWGGQRFSKDHSWRIAEIAVSGSESKKKIQHIYFKQHQYQCVFWRGSRKKLKCSHPKKKKLQHILLPDTTVTSNWTGLLCSEENYKWDELEIWRVFPYQKVVYFRFILLSILK